MNDQLWTATLTRRINELERRVEALKRRNWRLHSRYAKQRARAEFWKQKARRG